MPRVKTESQDVLPFSLTDVAGAARRYWWLVILAAAVAAAAGRTWAARQTDLFRSSATIYGADPRDEVDVAGMIKAAAVNSGVLSKCLEAAGEPERPFAFTGNQRLPAGFEIASELHNVYLSVNTTTPDVSAKMANAWAEATVAYLQEKLSHQGISEREGSLDKIQEREKELSGRIEGLNRQLNELGYYKVDVDATNAAVNRAQLGPGKVVDRKVPQIRFSNTLEAAIETVAARTTALKMDLQRLQAEEQVLSGKVTAADVLEIAGSSHGPTLSKSAHDLEETRAALLAERTAPTPRSEQIASLSGQIEKIAAAIIGLCPDLLQENKARQQLLTGEIGKMDALRAQLAGQLVQARAKRAFLEDEISEVEASRELLNDAITGKMRASAIELTLLDKAAPVTTPVRQASALLLTAFLAVAGAGAGLGLALLREKNLNRVRGARDLEQRFQAASAASIPFVADPTLDHALKSGSPAAEALKKLALRVLSTPHQGQGLIASVLSGRDGVGKTWIAGNIAGLATSAGKRVLLIDAAGTGESISRRWGVSGTTSIYTLASQGQWVPSAAVEKNGIAVLPAGADNGGALLTPERLAHLAQALRSNYDLVVIDTPALLASAAANAFAAVSDVNVLVILSRQTGNAEVERLLELLNDGDSRRLMPVVNRIDPQDLTADGF